MCINKLTNILSLGWRLPNNWTIISQKVTHEKLAKVFLELLHGDLWSAVRWLHASVVHVDLHGQVLAHMHSIGKTMVNRIQFLQHHKEVSEENDHFIGWIIQNLHDQLDVLLQVLDEGVQSLVADLVDWVEEGSYEVSFDLYFLKFGILTAH